MDRPESLTNRKLKVALLSDFYPPVLGGLELHVQGLAVELSARGHDVHIITLTPRAGRSSTGITQHQVTSAASRVIRYEQPDRPFALPIPDPELGLRLNRLIKRIEPDVIHAHNWIAASLLRPSKRPPLVFTAHDYLLICSKRTLMDASCNCCTGPDLVKCLRCASDGYGRVRGSALVLGTIAGRQVLRAQAVVSVSEAVQQKIEPYVGKSVVIPSFVPDALLMEGPPVAGLPNEPFVMYAGAMGKNKGVDVLLDLWRGKEPIRVPLLLALTQDCDLALPQNVSVLRLSRSETLTAWRASSIAVVPSIWPEPFGTVAIEAMMMQTPVIATAVGGLQYLLEDGKHGLIVPPRNGPALRSAILQLLSNDALRLEMGQAAAHRSLMYLASQIVPQIESVYRRTLQGASS